MPSARRMLADPYPRKLLLSAREIMDLLALDKSTWYEFLADPGNGFPKPVSVGKTKQKKPRHRWRKAEVLAWIYLLQTDHGQG